MSLTLKPRSLTLRSTALVFALSLSLLACGTDDGDPQTDTSSPTDTVGVDTMGPDGTVADTFSPPADIPMTAGTVKNLRAISQAAGCNPDGIVNIDPAVALSQVVVTTPRFEPATGLHGYYVADQEGGEFSGIAISIDATEETNFVPGDVLDLTGELVEFFCFSQVSVATYTAGTPITAPAAVEVAPSALGAEANEGRLVTVKDVTVIEAAGGGTFAVTGGFVVDHDFDFFLTMDVGANYDVTGVVKWSFNSWRLMPRTTNDIRKLGGGTGTEITAIQSGADSVDCTANEIQNFAAGLQVTGVVTTARLDLAATLHGYFISDGTQDDYSGIQFAVNKNLATNFSVGDVVTLTGRHVEFFCMTQLTADTVDLVTDSALTAPEPRVIAKGLSDADLEKLEGMLVTMEDVTVTGETEFGEAETDGGVLIDKRLMGSAFVVPATDTEFASVSGIMHYSFSRYRIAPRSAADLVEATTEQ